MRFGLTEDTIAKIQNVFTQFPPVEMVILYGSRAKGNFKPGSDIDLTVSGNGVDLSLLNDISCRLDDLLLPFMIDISVYDHISNPDLLEHISRAGVTFYEKAS